MRDELYENTAAPQNLKTQKIFYHVYNVLFIICCVVLGLCFFCIFYLPMQFIPMFLLIAAFVVIFGGTCFFVKRKLLLYYDYTYIGGEVRIIKVVNGKFRKKYMIFPCKEIYKVGIVGSETFEKLYYTPNIKRKIATPNGLGAKNRLYYLAVKTGDENALVVLECQEKFLSYIVDYSGKSIIEPDYGKTQA